VKWNARLWFTQPGVVIADYAGSPILEEIPASGKLPTARTIALNDLEAYPVLNTGWNTLCLPDVSKSGARVIPYLRQALSTIPTKACLGASRLLYAAWLLSSVQIQPIVQAISGLQNRFSKITAHDSDFSQPAIVEKLPATVAGVAAAAVSQDTLPSSLDPPAPTEQPAPPNH